MIVYGAFPAAGFFQDFLLGYRCGIVWSTGGEFERSTLQDQAGTTLSSELVQSTISDCICFLNKHFAELREAVGTQDLYNWEAAGMDFWFSRVGHKAGYPESLSTSCPEIAQQLDDAAKAFGELTPYIDGRGLICAR